MSGERRRITCPGCNRDTRVHARGLCQRCYNAHRTAGTLLDHERRHRPNDEVVQDWELLRGEGYTVHQAAERLGMTYKALDQALRRALLNGDTRAWRPVTHPNQYTQARAS